MAAPARLELLLLEGTRDGFVVYLHPKHESRVLSHPRTTLANPNESQYLQLEI